VGAVCLTSELPCSVVLSAVSGNFTIDFVGKEMIIPYNTFLTTKMISRLRSGVLHCQKSTVYKTAIKLVVIDIAEIK